MSREKIIIGVLATTTVVSSVVAYRFNHDAQRILGLQHKVCNERDEALAWLYGSHYTLKYLLHLMEEQDIHVEMDEFDLIAVKAFLPDENDLREVA